MSVEQNPNHDLSERIKASVSSLKELIIIFASITITASFGIFVQGHLSEMPGGSQSAAMVTLNAGIEKDSLILLLLVLCVMRFYHGNIMILDRYYLIPKQYSQHCREITLDSTAILLMTFGLAFLGMLVRNYVLFFFVYVLITLTSVFWSARVNVTNFRRIVKYKNPYYSVPDELKDELITQMNWFLVNTGFLIAITILTLVAIMSSSTPIFTSTNQALIIKFDFSDLMFWLLSGLVLLNSTVDLYLNRKEYFPRRVNKSIYVASE